MSPAVAELLVLELFEELVDLPAVERKPLLEKRLAGRSDAKHLTTRVMRLIEIESEMGEPGIGEDQVALFDALASGAENSSDNDLAPGTKLDGFEVIEAVGHGGMGTVYRARQLEPARDVALKVLRKRASAGGELANRFAREGNFLARLSHPGIAAIFSMGVGDSQPWIAMEFVEKARDIVSFARESKLGERAILKLFLDGIAAVQHGHQKGIVHRDLKPDNLLVGGDGRVKVIDFGVAGILGEQEDSELLGTLPYMAPETLGRDGKGDVRCDVFALGVVLFELLFKRRPREVTGLPSIEALRRVVAEPIRIPSDELRLPLTWILQRALCAEPCGRYSSAETLARDLKAYLADEPVDARDLGPATQRQKYLLGLFAKRHWGLVTTSLVVVAGLSGGMILANRAASRESDANAKAQLLAIDLAAALQASEDSAAQQAIEHERNRELSAELFGMSLDLVTDFASKVATFEGSLDVRRDMIESGLFQLQALASASDELPPAMIVGLIKAELALGDVMGNVLKPNLGEFAQAGSAYDRAAALLSTLPSAEAMTFESGMVAAGLTRRRGTLARATGDFDQSLVLYQAWMSELEALVSLATGPEVHTLAMQQALAGSRIGAIVGGVQRDDAGALAAFEGAVQSYRGILAASPAGLDLNEPKFLLQQTLGQCASAHAAMGDHAAAQVARDEATTLLDELVAEQPSNVAFLLSRTGAAMQDVFRLQQSGDFAGAVSVGDDAKQLLKAHLVAEPANTRIRTNLGILESMLGKNSEVWSRSFPATEAQSVQLHEDEAKALYKVALDVFDQLEADGALTGSANVYRQQAIDGLAKLTGE